MLKAAAWGFFRIHLRANFNALQRLVRSVDAISELSLSLCTTPGHWCLHKRSLYICLVPWILWVLPRAHILWYTGSDSQGDLCSWVYLDGSKKLSVTVVSPGLSAEDRNHHSQSSWKMYIVYFKSHCLRVCLPTSLHLGTDWDPLLWDTDKS